MSSSFFIRINNNNNKTTAKRNTFYMLEVAQLLIQGLNGAHNHINQLIQTLTLPFCA